MEIFLIVLLVVGMIGIAVGSLIIGKDGGEDIVALGGILVIISLCGLVVVSFTSDESTYEIETNKPIVPELRITVKDSVTIDTVYIYIYIK